MKTLGNIFTVLLIGGVIACQPKEQEKVESQQKIKETISPISIKGLRDRTYESSLIFEKKLQSTEKYSSDLLSYYSDSLKIFVLLNTPSIPPTDAGYLVLIFGHGFHPEPKKYGVSTQTGKDWRPGDYYRGVPEAFAEQGYLVVTPDYRGHNVSEGFEFTQMSYLASNFYTIDVLHLIAALSSLDNADLSNVFFLGHSMGGDVGLRTILATDKVKAASLWAPVSASTLDQALYYGKYYDSKTDVTDQSKMDGYTSRLNEKISALDFEHDLDHGDNINYVDEITTPLIIQHSRGDESVPYIWSELLAAKLYKYNKTFELYDYSSKNHLFKDENKALAIERDIRFFQKYKSE